MATAPRTGAVGNLYFERQVSQEGVEERTRTGLQMLQTTYLPKTCLLLPLSLCSSSLHAQVASVLPI